MHSAINILSAEPPSFEQQRTSCPPTLMAFIRLPSPSGMDMIHTPVMTKRLKAAEPTIVPGPNAPASKLFPTISIMERRISGAL